MNEEVKVSIVIPVYNAEKYIKDCVKSILVQSYDNWELVLVDDGSEEDSGIICEEYAKQDPRIIVIHQSNKGAASARKTGMLHVTAPYVTFIDADDRVAPDYIEFFVNNIGQSDLVTCGCVWTGLDGKIVEYKDLFDEGIYEKEKLIYFIDNMIVYKKERYNDGCLPFMCAKMYRTDISREVIKDCSDNIRYAEDREFLFRYVLECSSITVTHKLNYYYEQRESSVCNTINKYFLRDIGQLYLSLSERFSSHPRSDSLMLQLELFIGSRVEWVHTLMGWMPESRVPRYYPSITDGLENKRIILYGAGSIGNSVHRSFIDSKLNVVLWVDRNYKEFNDCFYEIHDPKEIYDIEYDVIYVAVGQKLRNEVISQLVGMGISKEKLVWKKLVRI